MKLTDEQLEFLQKFMEKDQRFRQTTAIYREAVMDKAVEKGWIFISFEWLEAVEREWMVNIGACVEVQFQGFGSTRFIALVNALMEAEGDEQDDKGSISKD